MSLARLVTPSASIMSTSRMIGRWLASSALAAASSSSFELLDLEVAADPLEQPVDDVIAPIQLVDPLADRRRGPEQHANLAPGRERQHLLGVDVERVGGGHLEVGIGLAHRHDVEPAGHLLRDGLLELRVEAGEIGDREAEPGRDRLQDLVVADELPLDQDLPERCRDGGGLLPDHRDRAIRQQRVDRVDQPFIGELHHSALAVMRSRGSAGEGLPVGR